MTDILPVTNESQYVPDPPECPDCGYTRFHLAVDRPSLVAWVCIACNAVVMALPDGGKIDKAIRRARKGK